MDGRRARRLALVAGLLALWPAAPATLAPLPADGMVAAAHPLAAAAGATVLAQGGNAFDAAIATAAALGVVEPFGSGLGGGGFLLAYDAASDTVVALDCREAAPAAATPDMFLDPASGRAYPRAVVGTSGLGVGAPGVARCWDEVLRRWGRLERAAVFAPAIAAARAGFAVTPYFVREVTVNRRRLALDPESARLFLPDGRPPPVGWQLVQPELAATLERLAAHGAAALYADLAPEIAAAVATPRLADAERLPPGRLTAADVASYEARVLAPVRGRYRDYEVVSTPAPSAGPTLVEALHLLAGFDLRALGPDAPASIHLLGEALRVAEADRLRWLGDPMFAAVPCAGLLSPAYAALRRQQIALDHAPASRTPPGDPRPFGATCADFDAVPRPLRPEPPGPGEDADEEIEAAGTTHVSVVDGAGNAVAYTATLGTHFGAAITVPGHGVVLNNALRNFRFDPRGTPSNNLAAPGKRPRSSIAPALIFDAAGRLRWVLGAAGAAWITPLVAQLTVSLADWDLDPRAAVERGRSMPENTSGALALEPALYDAEPALVAALEQMGHVVTRAGGPRAAAQIVAVDPATGQLTGAADARRDGAVAEPVREAPARR